MTVQVHKIKVYFFENEQKLKATYSILCKKERTIKAEDSY